MSDLNSSRHSINKGVVMKKYFLLLAMVMGMSSLPALANGFHFGNISSVIQVKRGGLCMIAPPVGSGRVIQGPCESDPTQWWKVVPARTDPAYFTLENNHRCLDVPYGDTAEGKDLQVFPCHWQSNQQF